MGVTGQGMARRCLSAWPGGSRCSVALELLWPQWLQWEVGGRGGEAGSDTPHSAYMLPSFLRPFSSDCLA